jgi:DNA polymerase-1
MELYLVDGHALAFRAYYAFSRQPLVNSKGEETSAVYGFVNSMLNIINDRRPAYLAVIFDSPGKTFRHEMYEAYKANRTETPESFLAQLPLIYSALEAMNIPRYAMEGYEADDLIATLSRRFAHDVLVKVVTGDKDLLQLVTEKIHVIRPGKTTVLETEVDPGQLVEWMGLRAEQIVDYLALMGDSSDNIPGVRGVGKKTALNLLQEFDSMDRLYDNLDHIQSHSVRKKLEEGRESAILSRELVVLDDDAPLSVSLNELERGEHKTSELRSLLEELEFGRLIKQLFGEEHAPAEYALADYTPADSVDDSGTPAREEAPSSTPEDTGETAARPEPGEDAYSLVDDPAALKKLVAELESVGEFAVDVETTSLDPMRAVLAGIAIATAPGRAYYVPVKSAFGGSAGEGAGLGLIPTEESPGLPLDDVREALAPVFGRERPGKTGQNIKYDAIVLERAGLPLGGVTFDTMIASYCLDPARRSHGLDALARELCGHEMIPFKSLFETRSKDKDIRTVPLDRVTVYACEDADYTLRLKDVFQPMLEVSQVRSLFHDVEMPLQEILMRMETTGVRVDVAFLGKLSRRYEQEIGKIEENIYTSVGERFNINSTQQLRHVLFDKLGLKPTRKTKTGYSTDVDVLTALADEHEVPRFLLDYRQLVKLKGTYLDAIPRLVNPETDRVHTSYNQAVASTGRLSSSDPNLQNIPIRTAEGREIRKAFVSGGDGWVLLDADYSQIELRILAHLSGDRELIAAFRDDDDVHRRTAARIMAVTPAEVSDDMRSRAKTVNFGIVYGMGARGLSQSLDIGVAEAKQFIDDYFRSYPGVKRFIDDTIEKARERKAVDTMLGRVRQLPDIDSSNGRSRSFSERVAVNTPVQGTAADIIKLAMIDVDRTIRERGLRARMILQVHDELLFDVPEEELEDMKQIVRNSMEGAIQLDVPLKVDMGVGANWLEAH